VAASSLMSEHTPGPWRINKGGGHQRPQIVGSGDIQTNGWPGHVNGVRNASYSDVVCDISGDLSLVGPAANARLIAAAPDLLAACQAFIAADNQCGASLAFAMAQEAVKKATGET
jgi:hypothetical protein